MVSFENTEIAFKNKTTKGLQKAWWLFKIIGNKSLVKIGKPFAQIAGKLPIFKKLIKATIYEHFCGGETIAECEKVIQQLGKYHVGTILDYSVEGKEKEADFDHAAEEILATQDRALKDDNIPFCVFKLTGMARFALLEKASTSQELTANEKAELKRVRDRVERLCKKAHDTHQRLMVDAEDSWIQPIMDEIIMEMIFKYNTENCVVYNTIQMYRHDRLAKLKEWAALAKVKNVKLGIKVVRGAYMEKERERAEKMGYPSPIQPDKGSTDRDYDEALEFITLHFPNISLCAGTHNEDSSAKLISLMKNHNIPKSAKEIYFSQLLGMSDHISFNLAHAGYNVVKYVPYGPVSDVLPYLIRRADENTSVAGQTSRELNLLTKEKERRKNHV